MKRPKQQQQQQNQYQSSSSRCWKSVFGLLLITGSSSGVTGQVPTRAPNFGNLPCVLCPLNTDVITNPNATIPRGTLDFVPNDTTCEALLNDAQAAFFKPTQCAIIVQSTVPDLCGCTTPTPAPTTTSTSEPSVPSSIATVTSVPTIAPVAIPTNITKGMIVTSVSLVLSSVPWTLSTPDLVESYNSVVSTFLAEILSTDTLQNITATLINQNLLVKNSTDTTRVQRLGRTHHSGRERFLQSSNTSVIVFPLQTDANVTAIVPTTLLTDSGVNVFTNAILSAISTNSTDLIKAFQAANPTFFGTLQTVESSPTPSVPVPIPVAAPVVAPIATPVEAPVPASTSAPTSDNKKGISTGAIAGIVVTIFVVIIFVAGYIMLQQKAKSIPVPVSSQYRPTTSTIGSSGDAVAVLRSNNNVKKSSSLPQDPLPRSTHSELSSSIVYAVQASANQSSSFVAGEPVTATGSAAVVASSSIQEDKKPPTSPPDIEDMTSRIVNVPPGILGIVIDTTSKGPVVYKIKPNSPLEGKLFLGDIITEVDGIDTSAMSTTAITALMIKTSAKERKLKVLSKSSSSVAEESTEKPADAEEDATGNTTTAGSLASATTVVAKGAAPDTTVSEITMTSVESGAAISVKDTPTTPAKGVSATDLEDRVTRVVMAPPGRLGIVIDTTVNGPVVRKIKPNSPVENKLFIGDFIISIDGIDTRSMPAAAITAIMVKTAAKERKLTVLSNDDNLT